METKRINPDAVPSRGLIPTGIPSLDPLLFGGLPPGTFVLLIGESGAGCEEFSFTSITSLSRLKSNPNARLQHGVSMPQGIAYITMSRRREDVVDEICSGFARDMRSELQHVRFIDLSDIYFDKSLVPLQWYSKQENIIERMQTKNRLNDTILTALSHSLDRLPRQSLIVLNTLTELSAPFAPVDQWPQFTAYLRGLQRVLKGWGSCIYLILAKGVLNPWQERELEDVSDATVHFQWEVSPTAKRQRVLFISKFRGVLPQLEERELVKFTVKITPSQGFEVNNIRAVI